MFRLIAYAPDGVFRFPLDAGTTLIGSREECDICLPYTGIAQSHAQVSYDGNELRIEDLGSRRGVLVGGRRVREASLQTLDEIRLGTVTLLVEDIADNGAEPSTASILERAVAEPVAAPGGPITPEVMVEHLSEISDWVLADVESRTPLESLVGRLLHDCAGGALLLLHGELNEEPGIKFVSVTDAAWLGSGEELLSQVRERQSGSLEEGAEDDQEVDGDFIGTLDGAKSWIGYHAFRAVERSYLLMVALPEFEEQGWSPASSLRALGDLLVLGLVHHVGWYEPILPGRKPQQELTLDPALVVGESAAMKAVLDQLRLAVDADIHLLLRGEAGSGLLLFARSLHKSSTRREGPFITVNCSGAQPAALEIELFGAEVAGKERPVRRVGKLVLANGGTLFLDAVDQLPPALQDRLHRFLRTGDVEPSGSTGERTAVDLRVIASAKEPLEPLVGRDLFRVDLAYQLSRFSIDIPPLRERREDLPLLIQSYVNRFCHETGKRMRGITVKAMSALLAYDFPGNLEELENIARQLVYLCPPGQPLDLSLLPEKVRLSTIQAAARVDSSSDLDLDHLVGATERAAIREALRRCHGNKSQAARLLGLSRNGLALKMQRRGLTT